MRALATTERVKATAKLTAMKAMVIAKLTLLKS